MTDQSNSPNVNQGAKPVTTTPKETLDWRKLDFAADCLCARSIATPEVRRDNG